MELSIIIPVYNAENYIEECLQSVAACPIEEMECLIINDGSTDSSGCLCEKFVKNDRRFRLLDRKNGGVSAARNAGIESASGKYIMFLDADDYLEVTAWDAIGFYVNQKQAEFIAFSYYTLYQDKSRREEEFAMPAAECDDLHEIRKCLFASSRLNACWGKLFLLDRILQENIRFCTDLKIGEDFIFVADYFKTCGSAMLLNIPVYCYRQHGTSAMHQYDLHARLSITEILFSYNKRAVLAYEDLELISDMYIYYIRVLTNLFLEFSRDKKIRELKEDYKKALRRKPIQEIVHSAKLAKLPSYKKMEGILLKNMWCYLLAGYFKGKSCFMHKLDA